MYQAAVVMTPREEETGFVISLVLGTRASLGVKHRGQGGMAPMNQRTPEHVCRLQMCYLFCIPVFTCRGTFELLLERRKANVKIPTK